MSDFSTSVHPIETSEPESSYPSYRETRIDRCRDEFTAIETMYRVLDGVHETDRLRLLNRCRSFAWFVRDNETGKVHVASNSCRLRWCPVCSGGRTAYIIRSLKDWFKSKRQTRFLTLTLKHSPDDLTTQINRLYDSFKALRKLRGFKKLCSGGIWFFQVKRSKDSTEWHPHLHCVISGRYVPHSDLMRWWHRITGDSTIVDIKMVRNPDKVSEYVARYSSTPVRMANYSMECRIEIFEALHGRKLAGVWGTAKGISLRPPKYVNDGQYERIGSWSTVNHIRHTCQEARAILEAWRNDYVLAEGISCQEFDDAIENIPGCCETEVDLSKVNPQEYFW